MNSLSSLTRFLESGGARIRFFDMGRRLQEIPRSDLLAFEQTRIPYPSPLQQQAWFALLFQESAGNTEPYIWFLRLPLDEQGKLLQSARDDLMQRLLERLGEKFKSEESARDLEKALHENPYSFKPREERLATLHARISLLLELPPSSHYSHARAYFQGRLGWDQWSFVGYQGIADLAVRSDQPDNQTALVQAVPVLPHPPLIALCHCLENQSIAPELTGSLAERATQALKLDNPDPSLLAAIVRGTALSSDKQQQQQLVLTLLDHPCSREIEPLAAISGRAWELLRQSAVASRFLQRLAENSAGQEAFNQALADLLFIPGMRQPLLQAIRADDRSEALSLAIGNFFQALA